MSFFCGDFDTSSRIEFSGTTVTFDGTPTAVTTGSAVCRRMGQTLLAPAGVSAITTSGGLYNLTVFTGSATNFFLAGSDYEVYFGNGLITTTSIIGYKIGQFSLRNRAALYPTTAGRTLVVDANGLADANMVKMGPTGSGTAQTARDIGTSVLLSSGTGTGQVKIAAGYLAITWNDIANVTSPVALTNTTISTTTAIGSVSGAVGSVTGAVGSVTGLTAANLDAAVSSRMATYTQPTGFLNAIFQAGTVATTTNLTAGTLTTVTNLTNAPTSGDLTATMKTSVNAEVVDALAVDTYAEPAQGAPPATTTIAVKLAHLYKSWRNLIKTTSTKLEIYNDAGNVVDTKAALQDDGTTAQKDEFITGP